MTGGTAPVSEHLWAGTQGAALPKPEHSLWSLQAGAKGLCIDGDQAQHAAASPDARLAVLVQELDHVRSVLPLQVSRLTSHCAFRPVKEQ